MYLDTTKQSDGQYKVRFWDSPFTRYKLFATETEARHWVINHLQIEG
jgi:hypothetical protein